MQLPQLNFFIFMNLDTILDIIERNTKLVIMWVDGRRTDPQYDTTYFMEQVNLSPVISELSQIELDMMTYGGTLYRELAERLDEKNGVKIDREVITILNRFEEYSFYMFPDTRYKRFVDDDLTNEDCAKYLIKDATEEDRVNAKNVMLQQWREDCDARSSNFIKHIGSVLDEDIVIKATTILHNRVMQFAIMLDCVLLENHHDLLKMQEQYGLKILKDHSKILLTEYTRMKDYAENLLYGIGYVDIDSLFSILKSMPDIDGERPRHYYNKAVEAGYMTYNAEGYVWLFGGERGGKARLGYFLEKVYCLKVTDRLSASKIRQLERLFKATRLDRVFDQNADTGKAKRVLQWKNEIESLFLD